MFAKTPVKEIDGNLVFGLMRDVVVPDATDDLYTVGAGEHDRLDLISARFYGTSHLWWVIARVNNLLDPEKGFEIKAQIRVPTKTRLAAVGVLNV